MKNQEPYKSLEKKIQGIERRGLPSDFKQKMIKNLYPESNETVTADSWWKPPRWLSYGIAACWLTIFSFQMMIPDDDELFVSQEIIINPLELNIEKRQELLSSLNLELNE